MVFAAQALVPPERADRERILLALAAVPGTPVVKLRGQGSEPQTHHEAYPYDELWRELVAAGRVRSDAVAFATGPMDVALDGASGLVTVSSTAALEALGRGVPVLVLDTFGLTDALVNTVFEGSGCVGGLEDLAAGRFRRPDPRWARQNYFHPEEDDTWLVILAGLLEARPAGLPPVRHPRVTCRAERWRWALRLRLPGAPVRWLREARRRLAHRGRLGGPAGRRGG